MGGAQSPGLAGSPRPRTLLIWVECGLSRPGLCFSFPDVAERFPVVGLVQVLQLLDQTQTLTGRQSIQAHTIELQD